MGDLTAIAAFIEARLAEDEAAAKAAVPGPWRWGDWRVNFGTPERERNTLERSPEHGPFPAPVRLRDVESDGVLHLEDTLECDPDQEASAAHIARHDPARVLRDVASTRKLVTVIMATPHDYVEGDSWFSCSRAVFPESPDDEPGSACADDERAGKPCDCGRDKRVLRLLGAAAERWDNHADYQAGWRP